jgi:hypothetical protein
MRGRGGGGGSVVQRILQDEVKGPKVNSFILILEPVFAIGSGIGGLTWFREREGGRPTWYISKRELARNPRLTMWVFSK